MMSLDDARIFVARMRGGHEFRERVLQTVTSEELGLLLRDEGLDFDLRQLAGAMAECMAQLEQQMGR